MHHEKLQSRLVDQQRSFVPAASSPVQQERSAPPPHAFPRWGKQRLAEGGGERHAAQQEEQEKRLRRDAVNLHRRLRQQRFRQPKDHFEMVRESEVRAQWYYQKGRHQHQMGKGRHCTCKGKKPADEDFTLPFYFKMGLNERLTVLKEQLQHCQAHPPNFSRRKGGGKKRNRQRKTRVKCENDDRDEEKIDQGAVAPNLEEITSRPATPELFEQKI